MHKREKPPCRGSPIEGISFFGIAVFKNRKTFQDFSFSGILILIRCIHLRQVRGAA
jgi:hypothetical protein